MLVVVTGLLLAAGSLGVSGLRAWPVALRGGLAAMFLLTGVAHFAWMRQEMIEMVPPGLPLPAVLVSLTGVLELLGALALLVRALAPWSAAGLFALLLAVFPANVQHALSGAALDPGEGLLLRALIQLVFLAATGAVAVHNFRSRRSSPESIAE